MEWSENDKVSLAQLSPSVLNKLQTLITEEQFQQVLSALDLHRNNTDMHMSSEEKTRLSYIFERVSDTLDQGLSETLNNLKELLTNFQAHASNTSLHWTTIEKLEYENFMDKANKLLEEMKNSIDQFKEESNNNFVTTETFDSLVSEVTEHEANAYSHIYNHERTKWNSMLNEANNYADRIMASHSQDNSLHSTAEEKEAWNTHITSNNIHMSTSEKNRLQNHMDDENIHLTIEEKNSIDTFNSKFNELSQSIENLRTLVSANTAAINNLKKAIEVLN